MKNSNTNNADQVPGRQSPVAVILAQATVALKMQIISGIGIKNKAARRPQAPSNSFAAKQNGANEDDMIRNLKGIVASDDRWELFALGALGLQPAERSCRCLRDGLLTGFKEDAWDGIANLVALYSKYASNDATAHKLAPTDDLCPGLIKRTRLWLTFSDYFETLLSAVRKKNLSKRLDLYTDKRLIQYLDTIGR